MPPPMIRVMRPSPVRRAGCGTLAEASGYDGNPRQRRARGRRASFQVFPQNDPDLLLDRSAVLGRAQPQVGLDGVVELADGQAGHGGAPGGTSASNAITDVIAMQS